MTSPIAPILGMTIELNRERDPACCGSMTAVIGEGSGQHAASLHCASCGRHRRWLAAVVVEALMDTAKK
jgi:hypothetical protein